MLGQLGGEQDSFVVDERTHSLMFMGDELDTHEVEESCALLDTESPVSTDPAEGFSLSVPSLGPIPLAFDFFLLIKTVTQSYTVFEQQAHQLAEELKKSKSPSEAQRTELQLAVRKSLQRTLESQ